MTDYKYENSGDYDSTPYNTPNHEFNVNRSEQTVCPITNKMCLKKTCYDCETYGLLREAEGEDYGIFNREEVNHPERYGGDTTYECIKVLEAWLPEEQYKGFLRGNALKYLCRVGKKDETLQELKKAQWYLNKLIEKENEKSKSKD